MWNIYSLRCLSGHSSDAKDCIYARRENSADLPDISDHDVQEAEERGYFQEEEEEEPESFDSYESPEPEFIPHVYWNMYFE